MQNYTTPTAVISRWAEFEYEGKIVLHAVCMMKITYSEHATVTHIDQLPALCMFVFDKVNRRSGVLTMKFNIFFILFHSQSLTGWKVGGVFRSIEPPP